MSPRRKRPAFPLLVRLRMWLRRALPILGFAAALTGIVLLLHERLVPRQVIGLATEHDVAVSAGVGGRLTSVLVTVHQDVPAGALIATLDDTGARLEVEEALLLIAELRAEVAAARERLRVEGVDRATELLQLRRRLELDRLSARLGQLEERGRRDSEIARLAGHAAELARVSRLAGEELAMRRLDDVRADHDSLSARIEGRAFTLEEWDRAEESASERLEAFPGVADERAVMILGPLAAAIETAENRMQQARLAVERCVLRTPVSGRVASILQRPGEVVAVDEPVVLVAAATTTGVVTWLAEEQLALARVGGAVEVRRAQARAAVGRGEVESLGAAVVEVPFHALRDPTLRAFGLPVLLRLPSAAPLTPGERVSVVFDP